MMLSRIGFHACVWIFAVKTVKDTQCGFKVPQSLHLLFRPFLFHNFDLNKIFQFFFSCWREKLQRSFSTLFTLRDGLLMWRCWRWVSWKHALQPFLCLFAHKIISITELAPKKTFMVSRLRKCCRFHWVKFQWDGKRLMAPNSAPC